MNRATLIKERLQKAFSPTHLEVIDESDQHRSHAGYQGGGRHFAIIISAQSFTGLSSTESHRKIYAVLNDLMPYQIHALRIKVIKTICKSLFQNQAAVY